MLRRRLIPKLQLRRTRHGAGTRMVLVTTIGFKDVVEIGDPVSQAKIYQAQAADELIFLDLDVWRDDRSTLLGIVRTAAEEVFMPFTVGGGVRTLDDFRLLLSNGADKVSVNTAAVETPDLIARASDAYGAQCVVLSIDVARDESGYRVWTRGGTVCTTLDPVTWAVEGEVVGPARSCLHRSTGTVPAADSISM